MANYHAILERIDWPLLKRQRLALFVALYTKHFSKENTELLDGLNNFLEELTDAYEDEFGEIQLAEVRQHA